MVVFCCRQAGVGGLFYKTKLHFRVEVHYFSCNVVRQRLTAKTKLSQLEGCSSVYLSFFVTWPPKKQTKPQAVTGRTCMTTQFITCSTFNI